MVISSGQSLAASRAGGVDILRERSRLCVLGIPVHDLRATEIVSIVADAIHRREKKYRVLHANAHLVTLAQKQPWLLELYSRAEVTFCDGAGVQVAAAMLNRLLPHRTTPPEWIEDVGRELARSDKSVFWLGGAPETVSEAAAEFSKRTGVRSAGYHHGYFDNNPGSPQNEAVIQMINDARADLLIVTMGMPLQEWWINHSWDRVDACVVITGGALVDHLAGRVSRPPRWVANAGLEWAVRLAIEPKRLWRRYLLGLPAFGFAVTREIIISRLQARHLHQPAAAPLAEAEAQRSGSS